MPRSRPVADTFTPDERSRLMSLIRSRDTKPERAVRSLLHHLGYRFTISGPRNRRLPGKPDIVLPKFETVIMVHGCFWHRHPGCRLASTPSTNAEFWQNKFDRNVARDARVRRKLNQQGWSVMVIWECQTRTVDGLEKIAARLRRTLSGTKISYAASPEKTAALRVAEKARKAPRKKIRKVESPGKHDAR